MRNAGAVIHSHGMESCLVTMLNPLAKEFRVNIGTNFCKVTTILVYIKNKKGELGNAEFQTFDVVCMMLTIDLFPIDYRYFGFLFENQFSF